MDTPCDNTARCNRAKRRFVRPPWCRERFRQDMGQDTLTVDSEANNTDVNVIVERFKRTGMLPEAQRQAQYGDVTNLQKDLTTLIAEAEETTRIATEFAENWQPAPPVPETPPAGESAPAPIPAPTAPHT